MSHVERLKKFHISDVLVRDIEGEQIADQKIKSAHKSMAGFGKKMFRKGEYVCVQGESSEELYILVDGQLNVIFTDPELFKPGMDSIDKIPIIEDQGKIITVIKGKMINLGNWELFWGA